MLDQPTLEKIRLLQTDEITEHHIYKTIAGSLKSGNNRRTLEHLASDELKHYEFWKKFTKQDIKPKMTTVTFYFWVTKILGLNFGLHLLQKTEEKAQKISTELRGVDPGVEQVMKENDRHEEEIIRLIDKKTLLYMGSIVLGLNDALVELTGALAGLTLALQDSKIIAITGVITGIAASISMAAAQYLAKKEEKTDSPVTASIYTGITYILTVILLIAPYLLLSQPLISLGITLIIALIIIMAFNFYISVAQNVSFRKKFLEMAIISLGVAGLNFVIGLLMNHYLNINITS